MAERPTWTTYLWVMILPTLASAVFAGFISITASWLHIEDVGFLPLFGLYAVLYVPVATKRMAESFYAGPELRTKLGTLRHDYVIAVSEHPELRAWPHKTVACLMAASAILVRASVRAWFVMIVAILFFRAIGSKMDSELKPMWLTLTALEAFFIGSRAYRLGTLPLAGMSTQEMEDYFQSKLASVDDYARNP